MTAVAEKAKNQVLQKKTAKNQVLQKKTKKSFF